MVLVVSFNAKTGFLRSSPKSSSNFMSYGEKNLPTSLVNLQGDNLPHRHPIPQSSPKTMHIGF